MKVLNELVAKLKAIPTERFLQEIAIDARPQIEDKVINQLDQGIDGEGNKIEPPYTEFTIGKKKFEHKPYDRVTLNDKGNFWKGIKANVMSTGFELIGTDPKTEMLEEKYGDDLIKLTDESKEELRDEVFIPNFFYKLNLYFGFHG